ncbi:LCP family protein [Paenibacillus sp. GCM10012307]|uniref:LCP family protein n=1 Tax=Paenibacillus roseus TaxID=2798579 RepID=A0A934J1M1_9BACL|nr:LCP family protein [Paenibacillus roseus]MBJ6363136.1 LCP family protein [Paenibacillus roseus]
MAEQNDSTRVSRSAARSRKSAKPPKKKKRGGWGKWVAIVTLLLLCGIAVYLGILVNQTRNVISTIGNTTAEEVPEKESVKVKPVTLLLLGLDSREKGGGLNTDVIKVVTLSPKTKTSTIASIPRDTRIEMQGLPSLKANAYYARYYMEAKKDNKDNEQAHSYARRETREMFSEYLGLPINYTIVVNFNALKDIVDALGGIHADVDIDMRWWDTVDGTDINLKKGPQILDGKQALDFVRYRKSKNSKTRESSDFERNARQTQVISAILDKIKSLDGITKAGELLEAVGNNVKTDIHPKEIENMMTTYFGMGSSSIESVLLDGKWVSPYVYADPESLAALREALKARQAEEPLEQ